MNSALKYVILLTAGVLIGVLGMYFFNSKEIVEETIVDLHPVDNKTNSTKNKKTKKTTDSTQIENYLDSDTLEVLDTLSFNDSLLIQDTLSITGEEEEYLEIVSERLISKRNVNIEVLQPDSLDASDLLNLKADSYSKSLVVEFWESPLDLIGYELNRSRLKLFGFNSDEMVKIKRGYDSEKLTVQIGSSSSSVVLSLEKSPKFKSIILK